MRVKEIRIEHIERVLELYDEYLGPRPPFSDNDAKDIFKKFQEGDTSPSKIGSRWGPLSKLGFRTDLDLNVIPYFHPNFDSKGVYAERFCQAQEAGKLFEEKSLEYLASVELKQRDI